MARAGVKFLFLALLAVSCNAGINVEKAERECSQGVAQGCFDAGSAYAVGYGVKKNYEKAANLIGVAARQGHVLAQLNYGSMYEAGLGVERDLQKAYVWYQSAARKGNEKARAKAEALRGQLSKEKRQEADSQSTIEEKSPEFAQLVALHKQAVAAQNAGNYEEAERLHRKVVEGIERIPDFPANERARQLSNLASALNLRGRPIEALELLKRAQGLLEKHPSQDPAQYSTLHFNLGRSYALQEAWAPAEQQYREGIEVLTRAGVSDRAYLFEADAGLGYVYWKTARLAQAKSRYEAALQFVRTLVPPTHPVLRRLEQEYQAVVKELGG